MEFKALAPSDVAPQLSKHLGSEEHVLWQGAPSANTFFGPKVLAIGGGFLAAGLLLATGFLDGLSPMIATTTGAPKLAPALACAFVGAVVLGKGWKNKGANWVYAITDQRLMSVLNGRLIRSVPPEKIEPNVVRTTGSIVYWMQVSTNRRSSMSNKGWGPEGRYVGFHGLQDPQAVRELILSWRKGFSQRANEAAANFVAVARLDQQAGVTRVRHPETGLHLDVPKGWKAAVSQRIDGPLSLFGITILKRFIREGNPRPYGDSAPWNVLSVRGAPDAGLEMHISDAPLSLTLDGVLNDRWSDTLGLKTLQSTPDLHIGPFTGFSVVRDMPKGGHFAGFGQVDAPIIVRQIWLTDGARKVEFLGIARTDQPDVQHAVDAMVSSLSGGQ